MCRHFLRPVFLVFTACLLSGCTLIGAGVGSLIETTDRQQVGFEDTPLALENLSDHSVVQFKFNRGAVVEGRWMESNSQIEIPVFNSGMAGFEYLPASMDSLEVAYAGRFVSRTKSRTRTGLMIGLVLDVASLYEGLRL